MKRSIVVYKSKYGATQQYAKMISDQLGCERILLDQLKMVNADEYDRFIFCLPIYNGLIAGMATLKLRYFTLSRKDIVMFLVGLTDLDAQDEISLAIEASLTEGMRHRFKIFYGMGRMRYKNMNLADKMSWSKWIKGIKKRPAAEWNPTEQAMVAHAKDKLDLVEEDQIKGLLRFIEEDQN